MTTPALEDTQLLPPIQRYPSNIDNEYTRATTRRIIPPQAKVINERDTICNLEEDLTKLTNNQNPPLLRRAINYFYSLFNN